jgi:hypothetical protein
MGGPAPSMVFLPGSLVVCFATLFVVLAWRAQDDIMRTLPDAWREGAKPLSCGLPDGRFLTDGAAVFLPGCTPVLRVCVGWACLFFAFIFFQSAQKFYALNKLRRDAKKTDDGGRPPSFGAVKYGGAGAKYGTLIGDRTVGNMLEQAVPLFLFLYLHATIIDVRTAAKYGWYWLLSRSIYPFVFSKGIPWLFVSTLPGYFFIGMLAWPIFQLAMAPEISGA